MEEKKKKKIMGITNVLYYYRAPTVSYYCLLDDLFYSLYTWRNGNKAHPLLFWALEDWSSSFLYNTMPSLDSAQICIVYCIWHI